MAKILPSLQVRSRDRAKARTVAPGGRLPVGDVRRELSAVRPDQREGLGLDLGWGGWTNPIRRRTTPGARRASIG
jgi:hypothetical protein